MDNDNTKFASGFYYKAPNENAPEWIDGRIVIKVNDFAAWFTQWQEANPEAAWLSFDLKTSKEGKKYAQINTFEKVGMTENPVKKEEAKDDINPADIPF